MDEILKKAAKTIKKFGKSFESKEEGTPFVTEYKMMITADDGTSFVFEMDYDEDGKLDSKFMVLQEDEDGDLVPVSLEKEDKEGIGRPKILLN